MASVGSGKLFVSLLMPSRVNVPAIFRNGTARLVRGQLRETRLKMRRKLHAAVGALIGARAEDGHGYVTTRGAEWIGRSAPTVGAGAAAPVPRPQHV